MLKRRKKILEIIGLYELMGGSIGLGLILYGTIALNKITILSILLWIVAVTFYSFTIYAGVKLFRYHEKQILLSEIVQYLQIISFGIFGYFLTLSAGITLYLGFDYTQDFKFKFLFDIIPSKTQISYLSDQTTFYFYVNLIPILILIFLDKIQSKTKNEEKTENLISKQLSTASISHIRKAVNQDKEM
jgi:hypothetical protein